MKKKLLISIGALVALCAVAYTGWWFTVAGMLKAQMKDNPDIHVSRIGGFPGPMNIEGSVSATRLWNGAPQKIVVPVFSLRGYPVRFLDARLILPQGLYVEGTLDRDVYALDSLEIEGPLPLDIPQKLDETSLAAWRDQGGHITINHFKFSKSTSDNETLFSGEGAGMMTLDQDLQPAGKMNARVSGHIEYLNFLAGKGLVRPRDAILASTLLASLSSPDEETGIHHMDIGVSLQSQTLYAGPLAVARLPLVYWGSNSRPASPRSPDGGSPASLQTYPEAPDRLPSGSPAEGLSDPR